MLRWQLTEISLSTKITKQIITKTKIKMKTENMK